MKTNTKLKVGFWFGLNKPKMCGDNYFSYEFNENNLKLYGGEWNGSKDQIKKNGTEEGSFL